MDSTNKTSRGHCWRGRTFDAAAGLRAPPTQVFRGHLLGRARDLQTNDGGKIERPRRPKSLNIGQFRPKLVAGIFRTRPTWTKFAPELADFGPEWSCSAKVGRVRARIGRIRKRPFCHCAPTPFTGPTSHLPCPASALLTPSLTGSSPPLPTRSHLASEDPSHC